MKKFIYLFMILALSVSLVACGSKNPSQANLTPVNNQTTYTKEFTYLPSYNGVKPTKYTPATTEDPFATAEYLINNVKDVQVYEDYIAILKKDGWTITQELAVTSFTAEKDTHLANVLVWISDNGNVLLTVRSK